jgi:transcription-repair coupling factor (superfamily II helicase)
MTDASNEQPLLARTITRLAEALRTKSLIYIAGDEREAEVVAASLAKIATDPVVYIPSSDALPGDDAPASPANAGRRASALRALHELKQTDRHIACIVGPEGAARKYPDVDAFAAAPPCLRTGATIDVEALAQELLEIGYFPDDRIDEPGEIAVRGEVIDLFPADANLPVRIEITEGRIVAIRSYDPATQRTVGDIDQVNIGRAAEPKVEQGVALLAHLNPGRIITSSKAAKRQQQFKALATEAARLSGRPTVAITDDDWTQLAQDWEAFSWPGERIYRVPRFVERRAPWPAFVRVARAALAEGTRLIVVGGARDLRFLTPRLAKSFGEVTPITTWNQAMELAPGRIAVLEMPTATGFRTDNYLVVAAADLLGSRAVQDDSAPVGIVDTLGDMTDLAIGDLVVHEDHGIARVIGIEPMPGTQAQTGADAIVLEHADGARRLVPVATADRLWRYGADADAVVLDKLDGSSWQKRRGPIDAAVAESAKALMDVARARDQLTAPVFEPDNDAYERFASGFAFTETADQARAIDAVRKDLTTGKPMDRLVIGDVGFGKTEVTLRAAAFVALAGGQVAVAAPTTVLVRQHLETFRRRFEDSGIVVAGLSRLSSASEKKKVKAGLADGSIQVVIGTGAVAGKGVTYKSLGIVIIDEEQRFGAADKGKLRGDGRTHVLTLSATPIPRTLQSALVGLQQLSIIATPPARRQPIRTTVDHFDDTRVRIALMREKARHGQSFVVTPRIEDLPRLADRISRIAPELVVIQAHGKMAADELDEAMVSFADGRGDVLLATNIIEAGLDVPRANTMIVWRADRFGLAQLHQLRGRVGRGSRRGQILLITDDETKVSERTLKRLRTLQAFDRLGAGFAISARDLDMRGAGDLIGDAQAGHMKLIGVALYQHLLESALRRARGEHVERWTPELNVELSGHLPEDWIPEPELRVALYARLARAADGASIDALEEEVIDRFGPLPEAAGALMAVARVRALARCADVARVDAGPAAIAITPRSDNASFDQLGMTKKADRWIAKDAVKDPSARLDKVRELLEAAVGDN